MTLTGVPAGTEHVRRQNTGLVLRSLRADGPATRTELARRTGLAKATVGTIVAELEAARAVTQDESVPSGRGRPGRPVTLTGESVIGLGLEVNVDYVAAVALDLAGKVRVVETRPVATAGTPPSTAELIALATDIRTTLIREGNTVVGATVAVPGLVAHDNRTVSWAPNLGWDRRQLAAELEEAFGDKCPTTIDNDANCAALAESAHGVTTDVSHSLYITGTIGIGAGIVQDGRLVRGGAGFAGEVGHMPIGDPDRVCGCGRMGCWEASVGLRAMLSAVGIEEEDTPLQTAIAVADLAQRDPITRDALARPRPRPRQGSGHPRRRARPRRDRPRRLLRPPRRIRRPGRRPGPRRAPPHGVDPPPADPPQLVGHPRRRPRRRGRRPG